MVTKQNENEIIISKNKELNTTSQELNSFWLFLGLADMFKTSRKVKYRNKFYGR